MVKIIKLIFCCQILAVQAPLAHMGVDVAEHTKHMSLLYQKELLKIIFGFIPKV